MHAQPRYLVRQREYALILAQPHGLVVQNQRHHRHIRSARDLERGAAEPVQAQLRRTRALRKDQHAEALAQAIARRLHDMCAVERIGSALKQTCTVQERPPPAATVQDRLDSRGDILERCHQRCDVEKARVICNQHHRPLGQLADRCARIEVDQPRPAQQIVEQRERAAHDALQ
jgi:hypothetical protein